MPKTPVLGVPWVRRANGGIVRWVLVLGAGCAARSPTPEVALAAQRAELRAPIAVPSVVASAGLLPTAAVATELPPLEVHVERELAVRISSIALGKAGRMAVLGDVPYLGNVADAANLRALPLPNALRAKPGESEELAIFFGRDNEPRIMGGRRTPGRELSIYWRHTSSGWRDGREEIGQLGGTMLGALWGVLGSADPELVCRASSLCIIKRASGWTTAPAGPAPRQVALEGGVLWGLDNNGLANINAQGWSIVMPAPAWTEPRAFWATSGEAWVATARELFHFHAGAWSEERAPIPRPSAFWGASSASIWIVGAGGAAHFDGQAWRRLAMPGPLTAVVARSDSELWIGGEAGLFRLRP